MEKVPATIRPTARRAPPAPLASARPFDPDGTRAYCSENLGRLAKLPDACSDLIYIDWEA
jgi:hypothetical protein